jgi:ABC-2 type transport system ATP-binding protein
MPDPAIATHRLSKTYRLGFRAREVRALAELDLAVEQGSIYGFVGPNGAGKSTTIKILVGLVRASSGTATLLGRPIDDPAARLAIGYLPENPSFHDFMRPLEVLRYLGRLSGLRGADLDRRAEELLERVGLAGARDLTIRKFSKGMVQRLGLAQALVHDPPLLVLDEPMSGLDPIGRKDVRDLVLELRRRGKTVFFSTHILSDVETICDRAGMLLGGRMVREGPLQTLLDGTVRSVEVRCAGLDGAAAVEVQRLATSGGPAADGHVFSFATVDAASAGAAVALARGGKLLSVQPQRETLEETFVRLARTTGAAGADGSDALRRAAGSGS